jgi:SOS response regulatory protein OraA/RecX
MPVKSPMETALDFLSRRAYSGQKLIQHLSKSGFDMAEITETLNRLKGWGYLNDHEFGKNRIATLQSRLKSRAFVENDLRINGLEADLVKELMNNYYPEGLEIEIAQQLLNRKSHNRQRNPIWGPNSLTRSGFSENTIHQCFPEVSST